jgi:hypothetical protein
MSRNWSILDERIVFGDLDIHFDKARRWECSRSSSVKAWTLVLPVA